MSEQQNPSPEKKRRAKNQKTETSSDAQDIVLEPPVLQSTDVVASYSGKISTGRFENELFLSPRYYKAQML